MLMLRRSMSMMMNTMTRPSGERFDKCATPLLKEERLVEAEPVGWGGWGEVHLDATDSA
jgi:hypothetical protein